MRDGGNAVQQGLGGLYFVVQSGGFFPGTLASYQVVALDAHTGHERSRSAVAPSGLRYTAPVFDPLHQTLIVGLTSANTTNPEPGQLLGLDPVDLSQVRWSLSLPNNL